MTGEDPPPLPPPPPADEHYEDGYVCGSGFDDAEHATFTDVFDTREEAIRAGREDVGWYESDIYATAKIIYSEETMPCPFDAANGVDGIHNDEWGDGPNEAWTDKVTNEMIDELQAAMEELWDRWIAKHGLTVKGIYRFDDIEWHPFKPEPEEQPELELDPKPEEAPDDAAEET